jgi:hypothetical protein
MIKDKSEPIESQYKNSLLLPQAALEYQKAGLSVLKASKSSKVPEGKWAKYQQKPASPEVLKDWFSHPQGDTALGIVAGKVSGNLEVLDFDFLGELFEPWKDLVEEEAPGLVGKLFVQQTQNKGFSACFRCPDETIPGNHKLAQRGIEAPDDKEITIKGKKFKPRKVGEKYCAVITLIETRGEGGYFLACPSPGYLKIQGTLRELPEITPQERQTLINAAQALNEWVGPRPG